MAEIKSEYRYATAGASVLLWIGRIFGLGLFVLGLWLVFGGVKNGLYTGLMMGGLGVGFAFYGHWHHRKVTTDRAVKLAISPEGILAPESAALLVPWTEIEKIVLARSRPKKPGYMAIDVKDPGKFKPTKATAAMAKLNQTFGGGELIVNYTNLDGTLEEIRAALLAARPDVLLVDK